MITGFEGVYQFCVPVVDFGSFFLTSTSSRLPDAMNNNHGPPSLGRIQDDVPDDKPDKKPVMKTLNRVPRTSPLPNSSL